MAKPCLPMKSLWWFLFCCLALVAQPTLALTTDPPTCQLNNKNGVVHQTLCYGETVKIKATSSDENATLQWYRQQNSGNGWVAVTGATQSELTTGPGIYKAIFTFGDNSTCETENDTIDYWKAYQIDWNVAACRATISGVTPLPYPAQLVGASEVNTPIDPNAEITYSWQVIPTPVQAEFAASSTSIFPLTDGFFQDTTRGLHQVILTVSQQGSSCISVDTMEVTLLPLHVWADTIISYGGQPAIAVAHASGGTEPYTYTWSSVDTCLSGNCDSAKLTFFSPEKPVVSVVDAHGCAGHSDVFFQISNLSLSLGAAATYALVAEQNIWMHQAAIIGGVLADSISGIDTIIGQPETLVSPSTILDKLSDFIQAAGTHLPTTEIDNENQTLKAGINLGNSYTNMNRTWEFVPEDSLVKILWIEGNCTLDSGFVVPQEPIQKSRVILYCNGTLTIQGNIFFAGVIFANEIQIEGLISGPVSLFSRNSIVDVSANPNGHNLLFIALDPPPIPLAEYEPCTGTFGVTGNYVCNGGFETLSNSVPAGLMRLVDGALHWKQGNYYLNQPPNVIVDNMSSSDLFSDTPATGSNSIPNNNFGSQTVRTPNNHRYAGMVARSSGLNQWNEAIQQVFSNNIPQGAYVGRFYYSKSEKFRLTLGNIMLGMFFSKNRPGPICLPFNDNTIYTLRNRVSMDPCSTELIMNPQVRANPALTYNCETWEEANGFFQLEGNEQFLTVGGFGEINNWNGIGCNSSGTINQLNYFFIDDIGLFPFPRAYHQATFTGCSPVTLGIISPEISDPVQYPFQYRWFSGDHTTGSLDGLIPLSTSLHYVATQNGIYTLVVNSPNGTGGGGSVEERTMVFVNCPETIMVASYCDPTNENKLVLRPSESEDVLLTYNWQKKIGANWNTEYSGYSWMLNNGVEDGLYRLNVTQSGNPFALSEPFHLIGENSIYSGNISFGSGSRVFITRDIELSGTLSLNGATALVRGMATYNSNAVGGTVQGAFIDLLDGGQITMTNNSYMGPACQNMWGGIRVGYNLNSGTISLVNSTLEGAYTGIENKSPISLTLSETQIKNCYIGVKTGPVHPVYSQWTGSTFSSRYDRMPAPFDYTTYHNGASTFYRPGHTGSDGDGKFLMQVGLWLTNGTSNLTLPFQHSGNSFDGMGMGILDQGDNNTIHHHTFSNCHIGGIVGESGRNEDYSHNDITLPTTLAFKNTYQMEALGSYFVGNPAWSSLAALPMYSYGLYFKQTGDNISHRFTHNTIRSTINTANRYHVGIGNNGWNQKGIYQNNTLENLSFGIRGIKNFRLYSLKNTFKNNDVSVGLFHDATGEQSSTDYGVQIKCNTFTHELADPEENTPRRTGILIAQNATVYELANSGNTDNQIGGNNSLISGNPYPNANVWPTLTPRNTPRVILPNGDPVDLHDPADGWIDAPNWISIENNSTNTISYFRYENEFVQNSQTPTPRLEYPTGPMRIATATVNPDPNVYEMACDNFIDDQIILFPARVAVISGFVELKQESNLVYLSDPIPNPSTMEARIEINLPTKAKQALLQIVQASSGKVLQNIALKEVGQQEAILDLSAVLAGVYSYRLLVDGTPSETKKLVVIK